jgi:hypothetical protein
MFDEFFYRRRKNKGMFYLAVGFIAAAAILVTVGIVYLW